MPDILDRFGNKRGSFTQEGDKTVERDQHGNKVGYSDRDGYVYDKHGNRIGRK